MRTLTKSLAMLTLALGFGLCADASAQTAAKPTIVLVHGAFADSSSWNSVIEGLEKDGFEVVAAANPLRGVKHDAASLAQLLRSIAKPVILVGHSYGGMVITEAAAMAPQIKALVYVAAFLPETGESALTLSGRFPGSTLGPAILPVALAEGDKDLFVKPSLFHAQFAADVPTAQAALMAVTQRPITQSALAEPAASTAWRNLPNYVIYGANDRNIPPTAMKFMADRAHARKTVMVPGASHALMVSHSEEVIAMIELAATAER